MCLIFSYCYVFVFITVVTDFELSLIRLCFYLNVSDDNDGIKPMFLYARHLNLIVKTIIYRNLEIQIDLTMDLSKLNTWIELKSKMSFILSCKKMSSNLHLVK